MELLYNPDQMPESEVKETFVAREQLLDDLVELIKGQPEGAGVQHAVIIAPRGMGKTTVLLMVKFAVKDRGLVGQWQTVKFPEESYGIYDLADLWIQTLELIAADTGDAELRRVTNDLKIEYPKNDELQEAAYAAIRYWRRKHSKRLLLLVENFDQILEQINDERDNARLRDVLMNDGTIMILGSATNFFKEARAYDQPLYNFFKIYNLADLKLAQMQELLRRRAKVDRITDFETKLKQNASRLRALKYFTGGNPRLVLMLYRVVSRSNVTEVRRALEKLLDEVTPYYKAKVEMLPPQQRKILDHIARVSGQTSQGMTPKEIAEAVRLPQNQTSAQLKRLAELGYVRVANLRGRSSWYTLSEPLYAIWHQMRLGPGARERMKWLVVFLRLWYSVDEMDAESRRLSIRFQESLSANRFSEAGERDKALASYDHALEIKPDNDTAWFGRGIVYLQWSLELAQEGKLGAARERWNEALASGGKSNDENWPDVVAAILLDVVIAGQFEFARQLITEAGMEEQLFPLARAIDYLQTGDEALIEKLSPEVRGIVEEVVAKLRAISQAGS
jgi:DNA-binding transcriptional ArsR family regulator